MGSDGGILDDLWEYIPEIDYWVSRAPYGGSERKNAVGFVVNGKAYVGTGKGYSGKKAGMEEYNPMLLVGTANLDQQTIQVFPNPAADYIRLHFEFNESLNMHIITSSGSQVMHKKDVKSGQVVSVDHLSSGNYFVYLLDENNHPIHRQQLMISNQ